MQHEHEAHGCGRRGGQRASAGGPAPFRLAGARAHDLPDRPVDVVHYKLEVAVDLREETLSGRATLTLAARRATDVVRLDAAELEVSRVTLGDRALTFECAGESLVVRLPAPLQVGSRSDLVIEYAARPRRGLHFVRPGATHDAMAWTQGQDEDARAWFPCLDRPRDRATTEVVCEVDDGLEALSNGVLLSVEPAGRGKRRFRWRLDKPHPAYLVTLVVGRFARLEETWEDVPLAFLVPPKRAAQAPRTFGPTKAMLAFLSDWTGVRYPWPRYDQVVVEEFVFGGMENTTQTTLTTRTLHDATVAEDYSSDPLVVHELAHQWFGDFVTCREWSHAWLNEGFATFCEALWEEKARGLAAYEASLLEMREYYLEEADERYSRPIVTRVYHSPIDIFDRHLYEKGACVLHHLRGELGDEGLRAAVRRYLEAHALGPVETVDLARAVFEATGRDVSAFLRRWVERAGHPDLKVGVEVDAAASTLTLSLEQTQSGRAFAFDLEVDLVQPIAATVQRARLRLPLKKKVERFTLPFTGPAPDRVVVDPRGLPTATFDLGGVPEPMLAAILEKEDGLFPRVRAADALAGKGGRVAVQALGKALVSNAHWGLRLRVARALGKVGTTEARRALEAGLAATTDAKVRAGICEGLGKLLGDRAAADTLAGVLQGDRTPIVEAAAARALGATRAQGAKEALAKALLSRDSWNDVVRAGCLGGLAALRDPAGMELARVWLHEGKDEGTRAAAARTIGALAEVTGVAGRAAALTLLEPRLDDPQLRVRLATIDALAACGDPRAIPLLERAARRDVDGRARRHAREASRALRDQGDGTKSARLRDDVDRLRDEGRQLRDRLEKVEALLEARVPPPGPRNDLPGRPEQGGGGRGGRGPDVTGKDVIRGSEGLQEG